jgi:hypothetical protein
LDVPFLSAWIRSTYPLIQLNPNAIRICNIVFF